MGDVTFAKGVIECRKRGGDAAGLSLQYDAGSMGVLVLQTCLLPDREKPYLLSLELARHRIKFFIAKSEEWQMFDLSSNHPAMKLWEDARRLFTKAWTAVDPVKADTLARQSLNHAIDATERLALAHAEILLHRRFATRAASSSTLGVRIWPDRDAQPLRDLVDSEFDVVALPLNWRRLEVEEGKYNWDSVDRWMQWAQSKKKPIVAGPLIDFSRHAVPDWSYVWQHDYDTCRDLVYDHVERVVQRYSGAVGMWNLAAGLNTQDNFAFTPEQMLDLVRMTSLLVKQHRRGARTMVDIVQPFGEHCGAAKDSLHPLTFLDRMIQEGIHVDAIGVRILCGGTAPGQASRDLMQFSSMLDRFFPYEKPILISALGAPSEPVGDGTGGSWHTGWDAERQDAWVSRLFAVCLSKPFVESLFWCDLYDHPESELSHGAIVADTGRLKSAGNRLIKIRRRFRRPLGELKLSAKIAPPPTST
ncbi:MAG: endo-1,4-beta-xylanase [Phycisphaerales bacterium]|nr:endo-1,4-beta-xylanase [Phycisphaerales bacterium]